jgi:hypothetical protein
VIYLCFLRVYWQDKVLSVIFNAEIFYITICPAVFRGEEPGVVKDFCYLIGMPQFRSFAFSGSTRQMKLFSMILDRKVITNTGYITSIISCLRNSAIFLLTKNCVITPAMAATMPPIVDQRIYFDVVSVERGKSGTPFIVMRNILAP